MDVADREAIMANNPGHAFVWNEALGGDEYTAIRFQPECACGWKTSRPVSLSVQDAHKIWAKHVDEQAFQQTRKRVTGLDYHQQYQQIQEIYRLQKQENETYRDNPFGE